MFEISMVEWQSLVISFNVFFLNVDFVFNFTCFISNVKSNIYLPLLVIKFFYSRILPVIRQKQTVLWIRLTSFQPVFVETFVIVSEIFKTNTNAFPSRVVIQVPFLYGCIVKMSLWFEMVDRRIFCCINN